MKQIARNLTDCTDGFLLGSRSVLMDRDAKFCGAFRGILEQTGVKTVRLPLVELRGAIKNELKIGKTNEERAA